SESSGSLLRKEFQLPENSFIFLMPARFDFVKGHDILLKAISRLKEKPEIQQALFILAGEGPEKGKIRKLASELEVDHLIQFLPHISPVKNLLVAGDALLIPSRWEAFPLIIPEAGFCKIPVIASHTYGIRRLIRHEENGLLFENENYRQLAAIISEILLGEHNLQQLAQKLYQESRQKFTLHKSMSELRKTYFRLTDGEN
ncbi:MAG: glycosyltransferase, partial [Calditrichaeota bacterium]